MNKKLAVITTHPIQYYAPVFQLLAKKVDLKVFYTWGETALEKFDPGFGQSITWDIPLLEGYDYEFVKNVATVPGSHHRRGIDNPTIVTQLKSFEPAVILIYGYAYKSHFQVMRHFKGKIHIWFRGDSNLLDQQSNLKGLLKSVYLKWIYRHIDKAFYVGSANKIYFKKYGLQESKLVFAPHAIDNERFSDDRTAEVKRLRLRLGIKANDILILFAGKLEKKKDPMLLLEAFLALNKKKGARNKNNGTAHLLFVGNGELEESLKSKVQRQKLKVESLASSTELSVESLERIVESQYLNEQLGNRQSSILNQIHFMDFQNQSQMPAVYQACDLFCLPSKGPGETWGLAVNEAMAAGKAILVSDKVGCAKDLVTEANGSIFKAGNLEDLISHLNLLLHLDLNQLGQASKEMIQDWSFAHQVDIFNQEMKKL